MHTRLALLAAAFVVLGSASGCVAPRPGDRLARRGDEIVVCGQLFHTGTRVVLWTDPGGYDAYRLERRFAPPPELTAAEAATRPASATAASAPASSSRPAARRAEPASARYGSWRRHLPPEVLRRVWAGGWSLEQLRAYVDLFVLHYDVCCTSQRCFRVLHDERELSVHFMLDLDGTIYQTLDLKERAWHAGVANDRSIGIEIANIGAYADMRTLDRWYQRGADGAVRVTLPASMGDGGVRTPGFVARPARPEPVRGVLHGREYLQYDLTPQQYEALGKLTATLCRVLPQIKLQFPRESDGGVSPRMLTKAELDAFSGILGHYHLTTDKIDPGPAFDWDRLERDARRALR